MLEKVTIFGLDITTYGMCLALAFIFATQLLPREFKRRGFEAAVAEWIVLAGMVGGIVGSKIAHIIEYREAIFQAGFWFNLTHWDAVNDMGQSALFWPRIFSGGGLTFFGGLVLATILIVVVIRRFKVPALVGTDACMPALAMGYFWGRLGCFFSGDGCYGVAAQDSWLFPPLVWDYPASVAQPSGGVVYNTPVIEALISLGLFFLFMKLRHINFKPGFLSAVFLVGHGLTRFTVEFVRHNKAEISFEGIFGITKPNPEVLNLGADGASNYMQLSNYHWWGFSMAQIIAFTLVTWGVVWIVKNRLWERQTVEETQPAEAV